MPFLVLAGCASTLTPVQVRTHEDFEACKREVPAPTAALTTVWPDGQFEIYASKGLPSSAGCWIACGGEAMPSR